MTRRREREFLPDHRRDVDGARSGREWIEIRVVRGVGIAREHGRLDVDVDLLEHLGEAPAPLPPNHPATPRVHAAPPKVPPPRCRPELTVHQDVADQIEVEPREGRVAAVEPPLRTNGTPLEAPDIYTQHSPLR